MAHIEEIWVVHPEFGAVKFTNPTPRQKDILSLYAGQFDLLRGPGQEKHEEIIKKLLNEKKQENFQ